MGYLNGVHWQDFMDVMVVGMVVFHGVKCGFKGYILTPTREELQDVEHAMAYPRPAYYGTINLTCVMIT